MKLLKALQEFKIELTGGFAVAFCLYCLWGAMVMLVNLYVFIRGLLK